jgi:hypothetical protein
VWKSPLSAGNVPAGLAPVTRIIAYFPHIAKLISTDFKCGSIRAGLKQSRLRLKLDDDGDFMRAPSRADPISLMFKSCLVPSTPGLMFTLHISTEESPGELSCYMRYLSNPSANE